MAQSGTLARRGCFAHDTTKAGYARPLPAVHNERGVSRESVRGRESAEGATRMNTIDVKPIVRNLPCALTRDELLDRADELSSVVQQIAVEEDRASNIKSQLKATMAELE